MKKIYIKPETVKNNLFSGDILQPAQPGLVTASQDNWAQNKDRGYDEEEGTLDNGESRWGNLW